jgi:alpha-tubulin suppressor-like RCC1 family protein
MAITAAGELYMWGSNQGGRTEGFVVGDNGFYTDGPVGVFGNPDSTIMYQSVPFVVDWSVFLGPNVLFRDIVKFQGCQTNPYEYYIDVSCRLLAIVDVPNQPSLGPVVHPTPEPVSPGNLVAFSWGSRTFTGNPDQPTSTNVLPGISIASLPRAGQYDRVWSAPSVTYIRDASDGSIWFWGRTDAKSPIASGPQWIPPTIYRPINTFRDLGIDSSVLHFAVCELTTAAVYAEEPSVIYIKEPAVAHQVGPSTVTDLICGGTAFAALLSNGTVWTVAQDSSAQFGQLGHPGSSAGILSSSEGMEVFLIAGSGNAFAIWGNNGTANVLSTWGGFPLGYYSEIYTSTPAPVNMDAVNSVITWNSVTKLEGDYNNFMVLLDTGDLIGFGSLLSILDISYDYDAAIVLRASHFSSPISQISLMEGSLLILLSDNRLFAMGESKRLEGDVPNWYPFQSQAQVVPSPVQLFVDPIEGMAYEITVLPRSCSVQASDFDDIGPVVIARATGPASPPNLVEQSHQLMSFGDNHGGPSYLGKQITYLGAPDFYPFQPSPRTSFKDFQMAGGFDFDLLDANYTFSTQTAFALHGTTLWAWGQKPQFAPIGEYIGYIPPTKVGHDVVAVAAFDYGALVIRTNSSLQCINIQEDSLYSSPLCGNSVFSAGIMFKEVSSVSKWDRVACGATVCVAFNNTQPDTPVAMWGNPNTAAHFAIPPDTFLVPHLVDVVVAGSDCLPDEGMLHYHYSENGVDFIFGSGSLNEPGVIVPVGLDASGAIKFVAGRFHVMVLFSNGLIFGWGSNEQRQLSPIGAVDWFASAIPVYDALFGGNVVDIGAVNMASLALMSDGALYTWGVDRQISELIVNPAFAICTMRRPISSASPCRQEPSMRIPCGEPPRRIEPQTRITRLFSAPAASGQTTETYKTQFQPFVLGILPAAPNANQPGCNGPPPTTTAFCTFNGGRWVWRINGDVTVTISSPFDASDDVQINGNLEVNDAGALVLRFKPDGSLAKVNVSGCARLNQPITASLSESDIKRLDKADKIDPQTVVECNCTQTGEIKTLVAVEAPKSCRKASATTEESQSGGRTSLNTLFKVNSKSCNNWWIILVSVLGGVLILVGAFLIALAASPKLRSIILPYEGSN